MFGIVLSGVKRVASSDNRWNVSVKCSDYDSLTSISRIAGSPDLEYMLRLNQLIINFVKDTHREEYVYIRLFVCVCVFIYLCAI